MNALYGTSKNRLFKIITIFIFIFAQILSASNIKDVKYLSENISSSFFNMNTSSVLNSIENFLKKDPNIQAVEIYDNIINQNYIVFYKNNGRFEYLQDSAFPDYIKLSKKNISVNILNNGDNVGRLTVYYYNAGYTQSELKYIKETPKVSIGMINNFKPFSWIQNHTHKGFSKEVVSLISNYSGLKFDIQTSRWNKAVENFKSKEIDLIADISYKEERTPFTMFSEPYFKIPTYIFGLKKDKNYKNNHSLAGKKVGVTKNIFYKDDLIKLGIKVIEYDSSLKKAKALVEGEIDYFLSSYSTGQRAIISQSLTNIKVFEEFKDIKKEDLRIGVDPDNPILYSIITKALRQIDKEQIKKLSQKWIIGYEKIPKGHSFLSKEDKSFLEDKKVIKMCNNFDFAPIEFETSDHKITGIAIDTLKEMEAILNIKFEHIPTNNWKESQQFLEKRKCDILPSALKTSKRQEFALFTQPYINLEMAIITKKGKPFISNIEQLYGKTITRKDGSGLIELLKNEHPKINLNKTRSVKDSFLAVQMQNSYATISSLPVAAYMIQRYDMHELQIAGYSNIIYPLSIAVRSDMPRLHSILNKTLHSIPEQVHKNPYNKWVGNKISQQADYTILYQIGLVVFITFIFFFYWNRRISNERNIAQLAVLEKNQSLDKLSLALDVAKLGTFEWDMITNKIIWNDINHEIFGTDKKNFDPDIDSYRSFLDESSQSSFQKAVNKAIDTKKAVEIKHFITRSDGEKRYLNENFKVVEYLKDGTPFKMVGTIKDITKEKELSDRLILAKNKAEEATNAKSAFLANMSHEIRTPMNAIIGMGYLLSETNLNEKQKDYLSKIDTSSKHLLNIINDILDFSKIEAGKLQIEKIDFQLSTVIKNVKDIISVKAQEKNLEFETIFDAHKNSIVHSDPTRIGQILINLCNNAIKFTQKGKITLHVTSKKI